MNKDRVAVVADRVARQVVGLDVLDNRKMAQRLKSLASTLGWMAQDAESGRLRVQELLRIADILAEAARGYVPKTAHSKSGVS